MNQNERPNRPLASELELNELARCVARIDFDRHRL